MFFYVFVVPFIIVFIKYIFKKNKPKKAIEFVNLILSSFSYLLCYMFITYFIEMENIFTIGWTFYGLTLFLPSLFLLVILLKLYFYFKGRK